MAVRFMILMPWGRVGSNLLFSILRQLAPMKLANENLIQLKTWEEQAAWFGDFYETGVESPSRPYIGSKQNLRAIRNFGSLEEMLSIYRVRVIRLRRDNHVKAAISQIRAEIYARQTEAESGVGVWAVKKGTKPLGATPIDPDLLVRRIEIMAEYQSRMMRAFVGQDVLDIEYEELNCELERAVDRARRFLDLPNKQFSIPFEKATPDNLLEAIPNFEQIEARLRGTAFANQLVN